MQTPFMSQKEKLSYFPVSTVSQPSWIDKTVESRKCILLYV